MLKSLFWAVWLFVYMGVRMPLFWRIQYLRRHGREDEVRQMLEKHGHLWTRRLFKHLKIHLQITGQENLPQNGETVLFVSNHQSYMDIPVLLHDLGGPHPIMAKRELGKIPLLGSWMRALGCIFVGREDIRAAAAAMKEGEEMLKSGQSLMICPEGTRSKSSEVGEFKSGAVRMALRAGVPIVPLAIEDSYKVLEGNGYRLRGGDIRMTILPMVQTQGLSKEEQKQLPGQLRQMIVDAMAK